MKKISQTLTLFMITSILLLPLGGHTVSASLSSAGTTEGFEYLIHYVKQGADGDCLTWETACDLQTALSKIPDQIWVAAGVYKPTTTGDREASFELESGIKIFGGFPADGGEWKTRDWEANRTTLSGDIGTEGDASDNSYHVVLADGVNRLAILDGFIITGGNADVYNVPDDPKSSGAGMFNMNSSPTLTNLKFMGNSARWGAGMYNNQSSPELTNVTFSGNVLSAGGVGAGMYNVNQSSPTLTDVTFSSNIGAYEGGGAVVNEMQSSPTLRNVTFTNNLGGGMVNDGGSNPILNNVIFSENSSMIGAGMFNRESDPRLTDVIFNENSGSRGGGMYNILSDPILINVTFSGNNTSDYDPNNFVGIGGGIANVYKSSPTLTNVTFSGNTASGYGGGMYNTSQCHPQLTNVTFWGNAADISGGGIANTLDYNNASPDFSNPILTNVILWGNDAPNGAGILSDFGLPQISYSDIQDCGGSSSWNSDCGVDGGNNIDADPLLGPLADNGGFTMTHALLESSPAIDAGDLDTCPDTDQRGYLRPIDGDGNGESRCDMGAYEYGSGLYRLDINIEGSGVVDITPDKLLYESGEEVTLNGVAEPGWTFSSWSGDASVTDNPLVINIEKDTNVTATFTQDEYRVSAAVLPEGSGSVTIEPEKDSYQYGEEVTLKASPASGYTFFQWSGDVNSTDNPLKVNIQGDINVTAVFDAGDFKIFLPLIVR